MPALLRPMEPSCGRVVVNRDFVGKAVAFVVSSLVVAKRIQRMRGATNKTEVTTASIISPLSNEEMIHLFGLAAGRLHCRG